AELAAPVKKVERPDCESARSPARGPATARPARIFPAAGRAAQARLLYVKLPASAADPDRLLRIAASAVLCRAARAARHRDPGRVRARRRRLDYADRQHHAAEHYPRQARREPAVNPA